MKDQLFFVLFGVVGVFGLLWVGGVLSALLCGHPVPHGSTSGAFTAFAHAADPSAAWEAPVGPAIVYWTVTALVIAAFVAIAVTGYRLWKGSKHKTDADPNRLDGIAVRGEVKKAGGQKALLGKASTLRPSLVDAKASDVGFLLGSSRGVPVWSSVEDSMVLLGPPRSGKGLHIVIDMILDAPGAVITTSTRPDNLTVTMNARAEIGPVAVFDPQRLAPGVPSSLRWSPIRGCENPQTAMVRALALVTDDAQGGVENGGFWKSQAITAVRCLLHAAALGGKLPVDLYKWSLNPAAAQDAVTILGEHQHTAAPAWDRALGSILNADPRQRDSTWAMVSNCFAVLGDPAVLDAVSPTPHEHFDPRVFLRNKGTIYLLGTATGASATAGLVAAFIEDVVEAARRLAAASVGARLDPPLALILDEAANYPLPSLSGLMSEGGGTGITTLVVLQSLSQARAKWGEHTAGAIWDSAIVKIILGGGSNARDLADLSSLIGTREEVQVSESWAAGGSRSMSTSTRNMPIMEPGRLRTLPFGTAVLMLRSAAPVILTMTKWSDRAGAPALSASRSGLEEAIRTGSAALAGEAHRPRTGA